MPSQNLLKHVGKSFARIGVPVLLAFSVAGCNSGGGGSSSSSTSSTSTPTAVAITQQNSGQVGGAGYQSVTSTTGAGSIGGSTITGIVGAGGGVLPSLATFAQQQFVQLESSSSGSGGAVPVGVTQSQSCDTPVGGGTAGTLSVSLSGGTTLAAGDTLSATFSQCYISADGYTINGSFKFVISALTGTPTVPGTAWSAGGSFTFTNLSLTAGAAGETINGDFSFNANTSDGVTTDTTVSGTSLSIQKTGGALLTLNGFNLVGTADSASGETTGYGSGEVVDSALAGYVNFDIPSTDPFVWYTGDTYPSAGTMTVTGANSTSVKLTAISSTTVELQEDTTGDGTYDNTVTEPWTSLSS